MDWDHGRVLFRSIVIAVGEGLWYDGKSAACSAVWLCLYCLSVNQVLFCVENAQGAACIRISPYCTYPSLLPPLLPLHVGLSNLLKSVFLLLRCPTPHSNIKLLVW
jgi:hypothetical protein